MTEKDSRYFVVAYFNYTDSYHGKQKHFHLSNFHIVNNGLYKVNFFKTNSGRRDMAVKIESAIRTVPIRNVETLVQSFKEKHINQDLWILNAHRGVYTGNVDIIHPGNSIEKGVFAFAAHHGIRMERQWHMLENAERRDILNQCTALASKHGISFQVFNAKGLDNFDYQFWTEMENPVDLQAFIHDINSLFAPYSEDGVEFQALLTPTTPQQLNHVQKYA